jgi:hypothetical protein
VRTHASTRVLLWMSLAATLLLWPAEVLAQRGRGGGAGPNRGMAIPRTHPPARGGYYRPNYYRPDYYRPYYYRPYYYRPYFSSSFYWGWGYPYWGLGWGWGYPYWGYGGGWGYPYWGWGSPYGYGPYAYGYGYYPYYYRPWYDDLGAVRIEAKPREAQVYVDGYFAGLVDDFDGVYQRLRAKPGEHQIELYLDGHQPFKEKLLFRPGHTLRIKHVMQPLAAGQAPPPKPEPIAPPPGPPSSYDRPGGRAPSSGIEVEPSPPMPPDEPSRESSPSRSTFGTLSIRVQPRDAVVLIDGERWEGGETRERLVIELSEGTHRIEVRKDGFSPYSTEVRVRRGEVTTLNVSLLSSREI